jgi:hypothetical protein
MNEINIDDFLRNNKPVVKDNPAFMLEVRQRLDAVEGIKDEVDRQRRHGRSVILIALFIGVATGIIATLFFIAFPLVNVKSLQAGILASLSPWKPYLTIAAAIAVMLLSIHTGGSSALKVNKLRFLPPVKNAKDNQSTH